MTSSRGWADMIHIDINTAISGRALAGEDLSEAELEELDSVDVLSLGMLADEVRRARTGSEVGYTRVLEIGADGPPGRQMLASLLPQCGEVRLSMLGTALDTTVDFVRVVRRAIGTEMPLTGFSLADLRSRGWGALAEVA